MTEAGHDGCAEGVRSQPIARNTKAGGMEC